MNLAAQFVINYCAKYIEAATADGHPEDTLDEMN